MAKETVTLNNGVKMPVFGLGTWLSKPGEVGNAVEVALKEGYIHVDCAHIYGNEAEVGTALKKCFTDGVVKREDIFITSKLWNTEHAPEDVLPACQLTLKNLQLDYLDLYLVHWPVALKKGSVIGKLTDDDQLGYDPDRFAKTWTAMEELLEKGLVKAIGISNFSITKTERLLQTAKTVPAVNQVECNPYWQQQKLKEYCDSKGIIFEAYSPLGNPTRPFKKDDDPSIFDDTVIKEVAEKHKVSAAQVCIAFALHRGMVVIPKTVTPSRITENMKATEVKLDAEDMKRLRELESKNFRFLKGSIFWRSGVDTEESFWDTAEDTKFEVKEPEAKKSKTEE